jgi:hypothetical protein
MKMKFILAATLVLLVVSAGVVGTIHIHRLEARVKTLENAQSVQLARTRVLMSALEKSQTHCELLDTAKMLVAVLEPAPQASIRALDYGK